MDESRLMKGLERRNMRQRRTVSRRALDRLVLHGTGVLAILVLTQLNPSAAQVNPGPASEANTAGALSKTLGEGELKTLKERLSDKASDEQRVDNCHVPPHQRGPKPRPDCSTGHLPSPASATRPH